MRRWPLKAPKNKWIALGCGWAFMLLGVVGLLVPVLPGMLFLIAGLLILSTEYLWASHILTKLTSRFPSLGKHLHRAGEKARSWTGESSPEPE